MSSMLYPPRVEWNTPEPMYKIKVSNGTCYFWLGAGKHFYHTTAIHARRIFKDCKQPGLTLEFVLVTDSMLSPIDKITI